MKHTTPPIIDVRDLAVRRSATFELTIPSLAIQAGSIVCIAGPNGSGKSTFITALMGLLQPDHGTITIDGQTIAQDLRTTKAIVGCIPDDEAWFISELTAREYISLLASVYADAGVTADTQTRAYELAKQLYFTALDQPLEQLSHGNKKKIQLIAGLMHTPKVIIVDELRNGLDPLAIIAAEQLIKAEAKRGACIVAATHDLWWAERISDTLLLLIDGRVAVQNTTRALVRQYGSIEALFMQQVQAHS